MRSPTTFASHQMLPLPRGQGHVSLSKNPLINDFRKRYHLRRENGSAEARRKRGGSSAEANPIRRKRAEARGSVAEGSPKQLVQTGMPTELFETDILGDIVIVYKFE